MSLILRNPVTLTEAYSATETTKYIKISLVSGVDMILANKELTKVMIRQVFSRESQNVHCLYTIFVYFDG